VRLINALLNRHNEICALRNHEIQKYHLQASARVGHTLFARRTIEGRIAGSGSMGDETVHDVNEQFQGHANDFAA
jgi:hypothetical protein